MPWLNEGVFRSHLVLLSGGTLFYKEALGNFTEATIAGYRVWTMLKACWMLLAFTPTMKRAVPLRTSTETFTMWIAFFFRTSTPSRLLPRDSSSAPVFCRVHFDDVVQVLRSPFASLLRT